jgi:hypothetical protein
MIDLTQKQLSAAMRALGEEINRGCWLLDRNGIPTEMVTEVAVNAIVTAAPGSVVVESITISHTGENRQSSSENGTQKQEGKVQNAQSGANTNTTTNDYKEP